MKYYNYRNTNKNEIPFLPVTMAKIQRAKYSELLWVQWNWPYLWLQVGTGTTLLESKVVIYFLNWQIFKFGRDFKNMYTHWSNDSFSKH